MENNMEQSPHRNVVKAEALVTAGNADFMQLVEWLERGAENVYLVDEAGRYLWRAARKNQHPIVYGERGYGLSLAPLEPIVFDDPIDDAHVQSLMAVGEWRIGHDPDEAKVWELDDEKSTLKTNDAKSLVNTALNWLEKENQRAGSEFYQTVNTHNVAAMGYSCGGIQALIMGTLGDKRIKTVVGMNTGAFIDGGPLNGMITKDDLQKLTTPIIYMLGGEKDDAAPNGRDDFKRINHVPVVLATYPSVGHTATYQDHQGGAFGQMARTWLDYQLKGKKQYENLFRYSDKGNDFEG